MDIRIIIPLILLTAIYFGVCFYSLLTRPKVKHLPKWGWALICIISIPLGGIVYFTLGRDMHE